MICPRRTTDGAIALLLAPSPYTAAWLLCPTPRPSCRRRARTRTCAPRAPRHWRARGSTRRRTPGLARPGICTPRAGSSSDLTLQSGSPTVDFPYWRTLLCVPRAASTSPGSPDRSRRVFTATTSGPPTGHPTGLPASTRRTSHPAFPFHHRPEHERPVQPRIAGVREPRWRRELLAPRSGTVA
jgi:hypothetical protein